MTQESTKKIYSDITKLVGKISRIFLLPTYMPHPCYFFPVWYTNIIEDHKPSIFTNLMRALDSLEGKFQVVYFRIWLAELWSKAEFRALGLISFWLFLLASLKNPQKPKDKGRKQAVLKRGSMLKTLESKSK